MGMMDRLLQRISGLFQTQLQTKGKSSPISPDILDKNKEKISEPLISTNIQQELNIETTHGLVCSEQTKTETTPVPFGSEIPPPASLPDRDPYIIQIGFDFGTSSCKCVYRDISRQRAWIYLPESPANQEIPFLLPSALKMQGNMIGMADPNAHYHENGLPHVKIALSACSRELWEDQALAPYKEIIGNDTEELRHFIIACAIYFLGGYLGDIKNKIRQEFSGFSEHSNDYIAVNLAIPVSDAANLQVESTFARVLKKAFEKSDDLAGHPPRSIDVLLTYSREIDNNGDDQEDNGSCFVYPEVSANIQGFVRSPNAAAGLYFFCDTGAATVDQCVFTLARHDEQSDKLYYMSARISFLGSSNIERKAMENAGEDNIEALEQWRRRKENGDNRGELRTAKNDIGDQLRTETVATLFPARRQLPVAQQFHDIKVLFGGGGHVRVPYEKYTLNSFGDNRLIVPVGAAAGLGVPSFSPPVAGMPMPDDLINLNAQERWYKRLTVAYGLSFYKDDLLNHKFPDNGSAVAIGLPTREIPTFPG